MVRALMIYCTPPTQHTCECTRTWHCVLFLFCQMKALQIRSTCNHQVSSDPCAAFTMTGTISKTASAVSTCVLRHHPQNRQRSFNMRAPAPSPKPPEQFQHARYGTIPKTASAVDACVLSLRQHGYAPNFPGGARLVIDLYHIDQINGPCGVIVLQNQWRSVLRVPVHALDVCVVRLVVVCPSPCTEAFSQAYLPQNLAS